MALSEAESPAPASTATGELRQETLTERDIDAGLALSDAAGWNQTGDDWALFIRHGRTIGLRDAGGGWVATAAALPYGRDRGWISMVLVAEAWRHRGLASRLLDDCVAHLRAEGIVPVLDATPAGAAVYRRLGFVPGFEIDRWERPRIRRHRGGSRRGRRRCPFRHRRLRRSPMSARPASSTSTPSSPSTAPRPASIAASCSPASCRGPTPGPGRPTTAAASSSPAPAGAPPRSARWWRTTLARRPPCSTPPSPRRRAMPAGRSSSTCRAPIARSRIGSSARASPGSGRSSACRSVRPRRRASAPGCSFSPARSSADVPIAIHRPSRRGPRRLARHRRAARPPARRPRHPGASARARRRPRLRSRVASAP